MTAILTNLSNLPVTKPISQSKPKLDDKIIMGRFGAAFGIKGWIKVFSYTDPIANLFEYSPWFIQQGDEWQPLVIEDGKIHGGQLIVKLSGCDDRNLAETYTHIEIAINADALPKLEKNQYYWSDLIGLSVLNLQNEDLGTVKEIMSTGSNDVLVVTGARERLIPFIKQVIIHVDLDARRITVDWDSSF